MKKIENRLILTNITIVLLSLVAFFVVVTINFNRYYISNIKEQLKTENQISLRTIDAIENQSGMLNFKILANSETFIYRETRQGFKPLATTKVPSELSSLEIENVLDYSEGKIDSMTIGGNDYYFIYQIESYKLRSNSSVTSNLLIISMISDKDMSFLNSTNLRLLLVSMLVLGLLAIVVSVFFSKKITKPIVKLTNISKKYAKRDFEDKIEVKSKDEIGELAKSMNEMATNLIEYEKEQNKFYRDLSHEIKTPLTSIYGYAEGINQGIFKTLDKPSKVIMDESLRIKEMLEDIILLNKLESKIEKFEIIKQDITSSVVTAIEKIEGMAILNDIEIEFNPIVANCLFDEEKMVRVMINLLSNALKHTKDLIKVSVDVGDCVTISVQDNGSGFTAQSLKNINSDLTQDSSLGNGLGLLIVKKIIKSHNGSFRCENSNQGALVIIKLPIN